MLEKDVQFCPHCNEEDLAWQPEYQSPLEQPAEQPLQPPEQPLSTPSLTQPFPPSVLEKLQQINQHLEDNESPDQDKVPEKVPPEERPGSGLFVLMILLSVCLSCIGFVMGIYYIMSRHKEYQFMGIVMALVSGFFMIFGTIIGFAMLISFF